MKRIVAVILAIAAVLVLAGVITGCKSSADKVNENISTECEKFNCQRRIVGINGITDKAEFLVEGKCSIEGDGLGNLRALIVVCKQGPHNYKKHYVGMSDNMFFVSTQLEPLDVSEYHTKIVLKPQNVIPDFDLTTGQ